MSSLQFRFLLRVPRSSQYTLHTIIPHAIYFPWTLKQTPNQIECIQFFRGSYHVLILGRTSGRKRGNLLPAFKSSTNPCPENLFSMFKPGKALKVHYGKSLPVTGTANPSQCKFFSHRLHVMCIVGANTLRAFHQFFGAEIVIPALLERFRYLFRFHSIFWGGKNMQKNRQTRAQLN